MVVAWGKTAAEWEGLEGALFGASLAPYLAFLFFLERAGLPAGAQRGFRFLLVFVFGSIPAAIYCKVACDGAALADVDAVHGTAESLLTVTNLLIVLGLRRGLREAGGGGEAAEPTPAADWALAAGGAAAAAALLWPGVGARTSVWLHEAAGLPAEPANALSLATWAIHVSSLVEWVVAMELLWRYAEAASEPRWKGLVLGMVPR